MLPWKLSSCGWACGCLWSLRVHSCHSYCCCRRYICSCSCGGCCCCPRFVTVETRRFKLSLCVACRHRRARRKSNIEAEKTVPKNHIISCSHCPQIADSHFSPDYLLVIFKKNKKLIGYIIPMTLDCHSLTLSVVSPANHRFIWVLSINGGIPSPNQT